MGQEAGTPHNAAEDAPTTLPTKGIGVAIRSQVQPALRVATGRVPVQLPAHRLDHAEAPGEPDEARHGAESQAGGEDGEGTVRRHALVLTTTTTPAPPRPADRVGIQGRPQGQKHARRYAEHYLACAGQRVQIGYTSWWCVVQHPLVLVVVVVVVVVVVTVG
jgi:hypothetical protein